MNKVKSFLKNIWQFILWIFVAAIMGTSILVPAARALDGTSADFTWETRDSGVVITGFSPLGKASIHDELVIPAALDGKRVIGIGDYAFKNEGIKTVTFSHLDFIGEGAFARNLLSYNITPLDIPVKHIGDFAFMGIPELSKVYLRDVEVIGVDAFRDSRLEQVEIVSSVELHVKKRAFVNNNLTQVQFNFTGSSLSIDDEAFAYNNLTQIDIPEQLSSFGTDVFAHNNRWVKVLTRSAAVHTTGYESGYGQVVNLAIVRVQYVDSAGRVIRFDDIYGEDLQENKPVYSMGDEQTVTVGEVPGYKFVKATVGENTFDHPDVKIIPTSAPPLLSLRNLSVWIQPHSFLVL